MRLDLKHEIHWIIKRDADVTAHFQFPPALVEDAEHREIERAKVGSNKRLELTVVPDARPTMQQETRIAPPTLLYYAVFIAPANEWAVGQNPPPEIDVGG